MLAMRIGEISKEVGDKKEREGGVLAVAVFDKTNPDNNSYMASIVGLPGDDLYKYLFFANEKIHRTRDRRLQGFNDLASSQSADDTKEQYGGCIVVIYKNFEIYFSYSGAMANVDEAVSIVLASMAGFTIDPSLSVSNPFLETSIPMLGDVQDLRRY